MAILIDNSKQIKNIKCNLNLWILANKEIIKGN